MVRRGHGKLRVMDSENVQFLSFKAGWCPGLTHGGGDAPLTFSSPQTFYVMPRLSQQPIPVLRGMEPAERECAIGGGLQERTTGRDSPRHAEQSSELHGTSSRLAGKPCNYSRACSSQPLQSRWYR